MPSPMLRSDVPAVSPRAPRPQAADAAPQGPSCIAVCIPVIGGVESPGLRATLKSVQRQALRPARVLLLTDDAPDASTVAGGMVCPASEFPAAIAGIDWVAVVAPGDEFAEDALAVMAACLAVAPPDVALAYGDEEVRGDGTEPHVLLKPAWSPVFERHFDYVGGTWFARAAVLADLVRSRGASDLRGFGSVARALPSAARIGHWPATLTRSGRPLASRRMPPERRAPSSQELPPVSVVIPTRIADEQMLARCLTGLLRQTAYPALEVILVVNGPAAPAWVGQGVRVVRWDEPFNWSAANNFGASIASREILLFLNDDIEVTDPQWLQTLVRLLTDTGAGAAGPLLTYPDGRIQHVGMNLVYHGGGTQHLFHGALPASGPSSWLTSHPREVIAITGAAMLVRREVFVRLGGFDPSFSLVCNDTDFCLRLREAGLPVLIDPRSALIHHEGVSRAGLDEIPDVLRFWDRWEAALRRGDPYAHPGLRLDSADWEPEVELPPPTQSLRFA